MNTEILKSIVVSLYCFVLWMSAVHFLLSLTLSFSIPISIHPLMAIDCAMSPAITPSPISSVKFSTQFKTEFYRRILAQKTVLELKALASTRKICGYETLSKNQLIDILSNR